MKTALKVEGKITEDGHLVVELPPELPCAKVVVTLEPLSEGDLDVTEEGVKGVGLTAEEESASSRPVAAVVELHLSSAEQSTDLTAPVEITAEITTDRQTPSRPEHESGASGGDRN